MTDGMRSHARELLVVGVLVMIGLPGDAAAQSPFDGWREPVVVELELVGGQDGERPRALRRGRIRLEPRESFTIEIDPFDQRGRRFPRDRFRIGVELDRECDGRVSVKETRGGDLRFSAGRSRGRCRAVLYVPGNLNLEYALEFEVTGIGASNYTRRQAVEIAERLYRAILQREVEPSARATAIAEVQRGRLENQVSSMVDSREFADLRRRSQPAELLEAFYAGLLNRAPDSAGADDYLREILRGRYREAIMNLLQSQEFEASLPSR
ncbi:MAG: DUF4214 domain-containing protein [Acidobacteria bacterium]|nr:DUF4214 domain-containing protein [Acidobacteriota bacterium]